MKDIFRITNNDIMIFQQVQHLGVIFYKVTIGNVHRLSTTSTLLFSP